MSTHFLINKKKCLCRSTAAGLFCRLQCSADNSVLHFEKIIHFDFLLSSYAIAAPSSLLQTVPSLVGVLVPSEYSAQFHSDDNSVFIGAIKETVAYFTERLYSLLAKPFKDLHYLTEYLV